VNFRGSGRYLSVHRSRRSFTPQRLLDELFDQALNLIPVFGDVLLKAVTVWTAHAASTVPRGRAFQHHLASKRTKASLIVIADLPPQSTYWARLTQVVLLMPPSRTIDDGGALTRPRRD
jgi:hypothetical protein